MSYSSKELSQQDSQPVQLFVFVRGSTTWRYCSGNASITYDSNVYSPEPMLPGKIVNTGNVFKDSLEIRFPISNAIVASMLASTPDLVTTLTVHRLHADDSEAITVWKGRLLRYVASGGVMTLTCESVFRSMQRLGLRQTYQRLCRHVLGGPGCNVNRDDYSSELTVQSVSGVTVTFTSSLPGDFLGGMLKAPDDTGHMIVSTGTDFVVLKQVSQSLVTSMLANPGGFTVTLYQGCDRSTAMCHSRFNDLGNHGGFPGIPWINPMTNISSVF